MPGVWIFRLLALPLRIVALPMVYTVETVQRVRRWRERRRDEHDLADWRHALDARAPSGRVQA